VSRPKRLQ